MNNKFFYNSDQQSKDDIKKENKMNKDDKLIIIVIIIFAIIISSLLVFFYINDKNNKKMEQENTTIIDTDPEIKDEEDKDESSKEESENIPEDTKQENYVLECKSIDSLYYLYNYFTFNTESNSVKKVRFNYHVTNYYADTTNYEEEYKNVKDGATTLETMLIYYAFDVNQMPGVTVYNYQKSNDTIDLDIEFNYDELENQDIKNAVFSPIADYTLDTMNNLATEKSDMCQIN